MNRKSQKGRLLVLLAAGVLILAIGCGGTGKEEQGSPRLGEQAGGGTALTPLFTAEPDRGTAPLTVNFDASASSDTNGKITGYSWEFGDGKSGSGAVASHTYLSAGEFIVTLVVTGGGGRTARAGHTVLVSSPCQAGCAGTGGTSGREISEFPPETKIESAIQDIRVEDDVLPAEITETPDGVKTARTKMTIVFKPDATAGEASALLASIGARVTSSLSGARSVVVRIPDPGTPEAYNFLTGKVEAESFVQFVMKGTISGPMELPGNYYTSPPHDNEIPYIDHHLAVRGHAAWNSREAIKNDPRLLVVDRFGGGPPTNSTISYYGNLPGDFSSGNSVPQAHGYSVLGVIAGSFDNYYTTGIYPGTLNLRAIDVPLTQDHGTTMNEILRILKDEITGKVVVNLSGGYTCTGDGGSCVKMSDAKLAGELWTEYVRLFGLEGRVLFVSAAGNIQTPPGSAIRDAETASPYTSGALLPGLQDSFGAPILNLNNTLVVENALNIAMAPSARRAVKIRCLSGISFVGGNISAAGTDIRTFRSADGGTEDVRSGTSYSAPQVAGLAAYLWSVDSSPTPQQLITAIISSAKPVPVISGTVDCSDWQNPSPAIDAYGALLSLDSTDSTSPLSGSTSPIRFALLDINNDDVFDETDLVNFLNKYYGAVDPDAVLLTPSAPDYGRYDLNGDGWTGGTGVLPFDLDRAGSIQYGPSITGQVDRDIEGGTITFDENSVTDFQVVCWYAYSSLFSGDIDRRKTLLKPHLADCESQKRKVSVKIAQMYLETFDVDPSYGANCTYSLTRCDTARSTATVSSPVILNDGESATLAGTGSFGTGVVMKVRLDGDRLIQEITGLPSNSLASGNPMAVGYVNAGFIIETEDGSNFIIPKGFNIVAAQSNLGRREASVVRNIVYTDTGVNRVEAPQAGDLRITGNGASFLELKETPVTMKLEVPGVNPEIVPPGSHSVEVTLIVDGMPASGKMIRTNTSSAPQLTADAAGKAVFNFNFSGSSHTLRTSYLHDDGQDYALQKTFYVDTDNDGIGKGDNCPNTYNPAQTDLDGNGRGDACDLSGNGCGRGYLERWTTHTVKDYHFVDGNGDPGTNTLDISVVKELTHMPDGSFTATIDIFGTRGDIAVSQTINVTNLNSSAWINRHSNREVGLVAQWGTNTSNSRPLVGAAIYDGIGYGPIVSTTGSSPSDCGSASGSTLIKLYKLGPKDFWDGWWVANDTYHQSPDPGNYPKRRDYDLRAPNGPCDPGASCPADYTYTTEKTYSITYN